MSQAWGRVAGKLNEECGCTGQQPAECEPAVCPGDQESQQHPGLYQKQCSQQEQGGDHPSVLGTSGTVPQILYAVSGPLTTKKKKKEALALSSKKGNKAGGGSGLQVL